MSPTEPEGPRSPSKSPGRVLLVDDEEMIRAVAQRILARRGLEVLCASDGVEALDLFGREHAQGRLDLVLLDLNMPGMSGEAVLEQIRSVAPELPVILMSGYMETRGLTDDRVTTFVGKPFRREELLQVLDRMLA